MNMSRILSKRKNTRLAVFIAAAVIVMAAIFMFSQQPGEASRELSKKVFDKMGDIGTDVLTPKITIKSAEADGTAKSGFSFILEGRKWGHVYLYALLGVFVGLAVREYIRLRGLLCGSRLRIPCEAAAAILIWFIYACSDELHQRFIDGRTGCFKDVMFDLIGFGLSIALTIAAAELTGGIIGRKRSEQPHGFKSN